MLVFGGVFRSKTGTVAASAKLVWSHGSGVGKVWEGLGRGEDYSSLEAVKTLSSECSGSEGARSSAVVGGGSQEETRRWVRARERAAWAMRREKSWGEEGGAMGVWGASTGTVGAVFYVLLEFAASCGW